jgi:hypothetical protein
VIDAPNGMLSCAPSRRPLPKLTFMEHRRDRADKEGRAPAIGKAPAHLDASLTGGVEDGAHVAVRSQRALFSQRSATIATILYLRPTAMQSAADIKRVREKRHDKRVELCLPGALPVPL